MKKHRFRALRSGLRNLLAENQLWAIHEPALVGLLECLITDGFTDRLEVSARLGMASNDPPTTQMVGNVAVLPIFGVISQKSSWLTRAMGWTATETLERDFKEATANSQIKAVVLYCDSPGGVALGNEETSRVIFAARKVKPIYMYVRGLAASACYYLGSAATQAFASPSSTIGSIGAVSTHIEFSKALAEMGVGVNVIRSAPHKQLWNSFEKLGAEGKASLQKWVGDYGNQFEQAVARHRGVSQADVKAKFGQGDIFLAAEAAQRGLIDGVLSWEQLLAKIQAGPSTLPGTGDDDGKDNSVDDKRKSYNLALASSLDLPNVGLPLPSPIASGSPATASAAIPASSQLPATAAAPIAAERGAATPPEQSTVKISARVRAALFARGLIQAQDADDAVCLAALGAYFAVRGEACPQNADKTLDDDKVVAALFAMTIAGSGGSSNTGGGNAPTAGAASNVQNAHEREVAEARQQAANDTLARTKEIRAGGKVLGLSQDQIDAAIDSGKPYAEIAAGWTRELAAKEKPVAPRADVRVGDDGIQRYMADAAIATLLHVGREVPAAQVTPEIRQLSQAPIWVHAEQCLQAAGVRYDPYDREEMARLALSMDGYEHTTIRAEGGIAYNRPGNFPNLLSNLASKVLDQGVALADTTYDGYAGVWPGDLPDFKPAPVVAKGTYGEFDEVLDAEEFKEQKLDEECLSYMQLGRFGNSVKLTPVLVANDDLGAFIEDLIGLSGGWELTKNRGCLRLLTGNVTLLDTFQLYDSANHGNVVASGAAPSVTQWDGMQQKLAAQTTIGNKGYARARLSVILVAPKNQVAAQQTFLPLGGTVIVESKEATTDTGINVFRGTVNVLTEPDLQLTSNDTYYGFADPRQFRNAAVVIAYFRGWGRMGKRERWYDPNTKCWYVSLEGRAGFAAKQYRTTVRNPGV